MHWLLLLYQLISHVYAGMFKYDIPTVNFPDIYSDITVEELRIATLLFGNAYNPTEDLNNTYGLYLGDTFAVEDDHAVLNPEQLEELKRKYPNVTGDWDKYNTAKNAEEQSGTLKFVLPWDMARVIAYRRMVINETILKQDPVGRRSLSTGILDFLDEYYIYVECDSEKLLDSFQDFHFVRRDKFHYVRHHFHCHPIEDGSQPCDFENDGEQGVSLKSLKNFSMRVTNGKEIVINTWRLFHGCAEYKIPMTPYPEFRERLEDLGFADDLLDEPKTPEQVLALRRFSSPKLGSWRQEMGKKHIYFSFVNYSTKSFEEDREWVATYVVLKIRNETYQDVF